MDYVLYRAIRRRQPRLSDFWSDFAFGEEPFPVQIKEPLDWSGISTFVDIRKARSMATLMRHQALAELHIPEDTRDAIVRQTGRKNPTHFSVMATPSTLLSFVAQVVPILDEVTH
jgi:hypothetical protein